MASLLPPSAGTIERVLEQIWSERLEAIERDARNLWNPWKCRLDLLPYLAWALSVDEWNDNWSEQRKRSVCASAISVHLHKGTRKALDDAIGALGLDVDVTEWFEKGGGGEPYTFNVDIWVEQDPVDADLIRTLEQTVKSAKNTRSHYDMSLNATSSGSFGIGCAMGGGVDACTAPLVPNPVSEAQHGVAAYSTAEYTVTSSSIVPEPISDGTITVAVECLSDVDITSNCVTAFTDTETATGFFVAADVSAVINIEITECF